MEKLDIKDFIDYKYVSNIQMSPDGRMACFVVHQSDLDNNEYKSNIWIMDLKDKSYKKLTSGEKEKSFLWLDNNTVLFPSMRNNDIGKRVAKGEKWTVYYSIDIRGGEAEEYMCVPLNVTDIKVLDSEHFILTATYDAYGKDINFLPDDEKKEAYAAISENKDYEIIDEIPFWYNAKGFTNKKRNRLYAYDKSTNTIKAISGEYTNIEWFSCNESQVVYAANTFEDKYQIYDGLYIWDLKQETNTTIIYPDKYNIVYADFIGNKIICSMSDMEKYGKLQNTYFYLIDNGEIKLLNKYDTGLGSFVGTDCKYLSGKFMKVYNDSLYFISTVNHGSCISKLSVDGSIEVLTFDKGSVECFDISNDEIMFIGLRDMHLQEVYLIENNNEVMVTSFNEAIHLNKYCSIPKRINFENDGVLIEGFVLEPVDYDKAKTYPAILDIHGGPKTAYGEIYHHEMQLWANMGYFVFYCNPRGSDGRGDEFADLRGKYGTIDYDDIMMFTDKVLELYPQIDKLRLGVTGGSYGGFMTNWIIGHTDRFACAASQRSIANWISMFCTSDVGYHFNPDQNMATPWDNQEKLWWHSPLKYADRVKTPTLFIHSEQDYRCWLVEGLQMFTALKYNGVESRLCMFKGENHELSRTGKPKHRLKRLTEITNWFEKYLK